MIGLIRNKSGVIIEEVLDITEEELSKVDKTKIPETPPTYEDRLSALESALLEMITGGETSG